MVPLLRVIPQWSLRMSSRAHQGWKGNRWVLGRWSHHEKSSSRVEKNILVDARLKGFEYLVIRV
jgi:hypothetical protein